MTAIDDDRAELRGWDATAPGEPQPLDTWAIVEAMGHRTLIGQVTEAVIAGKPLLKVDRLDGITQYVPPESLYMLTPCTKEQAEHTRRRLYTTGLPPHFAALDVGTANDRNTSVWADDGEDVTNRDIDPGACDDADHDFDDEDD